jgi:hypothetical protein
MVKKIRKRRNRVEEDPMAGVTNLTDVMLVIAVGFLVFIVISWNMQGVVFSDMSPEERQNTMQAMKKAIEVNQGDQINDTPNSTGGSGEGYEEMGKVYKDPETGKLILIEG